ncbi:hypothetical protein DPV78_005551 [Talaromyces pinophilus]|nr:hypothetical protein DPV78_005551 [Talaromyces pinophilus]
MYSHNTAASFQLSAFVSNGGWVRKDVRSGTPKEVRGFRPAANHRHLGYAPRMEENSELFFMQYCSKQNDNP